MESPNAIGNPFSKPMVRYFLLWVAGLCLLFLGLVYLATGGFERISDLGAETIIQLLSLIPIFWFLGSHIQKKLPFQYFLGKGVYPYSLIQLVGIWLLIFVFSYGADGLFTYGLSFLVPGYVNASLQVSVISTEHGFMFNLLLVLIAGVIAPLMEELVFRGLLLHRLATKWGISLSIVITSFLFGILHGEGWIGSGLFGLCMSLIYLRTYNLWIPIGIHVFHNLIAIGIIFISNQVEGTPDLGTFRSDIWFFVGALVISAPLLYKFVRKSWPENDITLPYLKQLYKQP